MKIILIILLIVTAGCSKSGGVLSDSGMDQDTNYIDSRCGVMSSDLFAVAKHKIATCLKEQDERAGDIEFYAEDNEVHWRYKQNVSANWIIPQMTNRYSPANGIWPAMNKEKITYIGHLPGSDLALVTTEHYAWKINNVRASTSEWWIERTQ